MNWDTIQGDWKQWQGSIQKKWGKLTNDDLAQINGERTRLTGILQERYGRTKDDVEREIDDFVRRTAPMSP